MFYGIFSQYFLGRIDLQQRSHREDARECVQISRPPFLERVQIISCVPEGTHDVLKVQVQNINMASEADSRFRSGAKISV